MNKKAKKLYYMSQDTVICVIYIINGALITRIIMTGTQRINEVGCPTQDKVWLSPNLTSNSYLTNIKNLNFQV
jgi:hypothetical protein